MLTAHPSVLPVRLTIDCSSPELWYGEHERGTVDQVVEWVRHSPRRRAIHVVLRTTLADRRGRPFKHMLQALGCTVMMRMTA